MSPIDRVTAKDALAAAGIPSERCGRSRLARLGPAERALYRWVLRRFANRRAPDRLALAGQAERLALEPDATLALLAREDLVHLEGSDIMVAYPFSGRPNRHRVRFDRREVYAMCAIDALGIGPMVGQAIEVVSSDPVSAVGIEPGGDWSTYWYNGRIYESDITRGLVIWRLDDPRVATFLRTPYLNPQTTEFSIDR